MGGPADSRANVASTPWVDPGPTLLPGYQLRMFLDVPRLEWRLARSSGAGADAGQPPNATTMRYLDNGSLLFSMRSPNFLTLDLAFAGAPLAPPRLLPSFADIQAATNEAFYRRLGGAAPLFGAPATLATGLPQLPVAGPAPTPFFKLPDPRSQGSESPRPRPGAVGDLLSAIYKLAPVQNLVDRLNDQATLQYHQAQRLWDDGGTIDKIGLVTLSAPLAAGVVGGLLGSDEARHKAFNLVRGVAIPVPFVSGLKFQINDFGRLDPYLLGTPSAVPGRPAGGEVLFMLDLKKLSPSVFKAF